MTTATLNTMTTGGVLVTLANDNPHQELIGCLADIQSDHQSLDDLARQIKDSFADTIKSVNKKPRRDDRRQQRDRKRNPVPTRIGGRHDLHS